MKKTFAILLVGATLTGAVAVCAAGGSAADPLISLRYLNDTYLPSLTAQAEKRIEEKTQPLYQSALRPLNAAREDILGGRADSTGSGADALRDRRVKRGDVLSLGAGSGALLLAGDVSVHFSAGAVVDITDGITVPNGSMLQAQHHYLAAEHTTALLSVTSDTAVISAEGEVALSPSGEMDYNALASALQAMGIFRGSDTGYGSGFDLEKAPTRIEGLILFLRLLGEENAALAHTGATTFADVPDWCKSYVSYAQEKGYTKGVGLNEKGQPCFGTAQPINAGTYLTFLLRALGYADSGTAPDFTWETVLPRAVELGVITGAEQTLLTQAPFLRAQLAYLSYFGLDAPRKDQGGTLLDGLAAAGVLDAVSVRAVMAQTAVTRLR